MKLMVAVLILAPAILAVLLPVLILARSSRERLAGLLLGGFGIAVTLEILFTVDWGVHGPVWFLNNILPQNWFANNILLQYLWAGVPLGVIGAPATAVGIWIQRVFDCRQHRLPAKPAARDAANPSVGGPGIG